MTRLSKKAHIDIIQSKLLYQTNEFNKLLKKNAAKMFVDKQLY